jgi:hypothetical protein
VVNLRASMILTISPKVFGCSSLILPRLGRTGRKCQQRRFDERGNRPARTIPRTGHIQPLRNTSTSEGLPFWRGSLHLIDFPLAKKEGVGYHAVTRLCRNLFPFLVELGSWEEKRLRL